MRKRFVAFLLPVALLLIVGFGIVVVNQSLQLVEFADRLHPVAGDIAFGSILAVFGLCLAVPLFVLLTLPAPLVPPDTTEGAPYERHVQRLQKRLSKNRHLAAVPADLSQIEEALLQLHAVADERTKATASQVFITTAISQNGSLDSLLVIAAQSKLILEIARIYYQRPTMRDLVYLYSNVAATAFIAAELEDVDLSEQVQP